MLPLRHGNQGTCSLLSYRFAPPLFFIALLACLLHTLLLALCLPAHLRACLPPPFPAWALQRAACRVVRVSAVQAQTAAAATSAKEEYYEVGEGALVEGRVVGWVQWWTRWWVAGWVGGPQVHGLVVSAALLGCLAWWDSSCE